MDVARGQQMHSFALIFPAAVRRAEPSIDAPRRTAYFLTADGFWFAGEIDVARLDGGLADAGRATLTTASVSLLTTVFHA